MNKIIEITDFLAPELDVYARLTENQLLNREFPEKGLFIAESPKVIERALDAGYEPVSCLMEKRHIEGEGKHILERMKDVPVFCAEFDILTQLGVGPKEGYAISGNTEVWSDYLSDNKLLNLVKTYIPMKVKLMWDNNNGTVNNAISDIVAEKEWRINVMVDPGFEEVPDD